ncbi:cellulase family glycosylhydrolase, partial [Ruminococcus sp.]
MKFMKKLLSAVTAAAIGATMTTALSAGVSTASAASKTAVELVEDMGLGWNLGNALDCTNTWTDSPTPEQIETAWGNISTTESMIKEVKKAGFNTVRIPVTWWDMTG